jgi:NAD+ synthase (glutamine-hydrolysing)
MRIALAQLNPIVGDLRGNAALIRAAARKAADSGAELLVCSELAICGYPPKDLLLRSGFVKSCDRAIDELAAALPKELGVLVGHPTHRGLIDKRVANAASLLHEGQVRHTLHKLLLPNYDVFDERRYFRPAQSVAPLEFGGLRLGVHICEDAWWGEPNTFYHEDPAHQPDPVAELAAQGVDLFINLSASPFEVDKPNRRTKLVSRHVRTHKKPFLFVNQIGGNDDLVFDGNSFVVDDTGEVVQRLHGFQEDFAIVDTAALPAGPVEPLGSREELILNALALGLKDYMAKSGFTDCVLGLSGGIDSALAACIAARAVGPDHVHGLLMPSRYSSDHSVNDAQQLADKLGIDARIVPIDTVHHTYEQLPIIADDLTGSAASLADQNLQARIRGAIVMTRSNRHGWIALATGNKSELAVGYCTLYGDMCGGFAVLCDVLKRDVYAVSKFINEEAGREIIPISTLTKPPSAELAPDQFDQDTLPPYPVLDAILEGLVEREESVKFLSQFYPAETVAWVAKRLDRNEFKRRQMPPGIKLSQRAFGTGRRMPMAARIEAE